MLKSMLSGAMSQFDSETIVIAGTNVPAVINETDLSNSLGAGAKKTERTLVAVFSLADYDASIRSGQSITARGQTWQVATEPGSIRRGQVAVTLVLVEPERRNDF